LSRRQQEPAQAGVVDEALRRRAVDRLGSLGDELAREILEAAVLEIEHDASRWEGSAGPMRGHRVTLHVEASLEARLRDAHAARDALASAVAQALAERPGEVAFDVRVVALPAAGQRPSGGGGGPYRDPR